MKYSDLVQQIRLKSSFLCVGLDSDIKKIPSQFLKEPDPIFSFNKAVIDATADFTVAYKPNIAFYEAMGPKGWESLAKTMDYIPKDIFTIADAKRGDIGNTSKMYAQTFFDSSAAGLNFDSVTVAPYMGVDSVTPFLEFDNKWVILLALTSNAGGLDFQLFEDKNGRSLYQEVLEKSKNWGSVENMMYVVGATRPDYLRAIRAIIPDHFLLVPGVGAQGGSLEEVAKYGLNKNIGLLVNSARGIIYAGDDTFSSARKEAKILQEEMAKLLDQYC